MDAQPAVPWTEPTQAYLVSPSSVAWPHQGVDKEEAVPDPCTGVLLESK